MTIFAVILLANSLGLSDPIDPTRGVDFYYTMFRQGHSECVKISPEIMLCPTDLDRALTPSQEIDREVTTWDMPTGCDHLSDHVSLCK